MQEDLVCLASKAYYVPTLSQKPMLGLCPRTSGNDVCERMYNNGNSPAELTIQQTMIYFVDTHSRNRDIEPDVGVYWFLG